MMKQNGLVIIKATFCFLVTVMGLWFLLVLSALIPNESISGNMKESAYYFSDKEAFQNSESARLCEITDNYADSISMNLAWNMGKGNPLVNTINTCYYDGDEYGLNGGLYLTVVEDAEPNTDYTRYWHGNLITIRILSLLTDIQGIKLIGFLGFLMLLGVTLAILVKRKHADLAVLLLISLAAVQIWNIRLSLEYLPAYVVTFLMIPLYLLLEKKSDRYLIYLSVIGGVLTAFYDFLTTETVSVLLPLAMVISVRIKERRNQSFKEDLFLCGKAGVAWIMAYGGTFLMKWIVAALVTGTDVFSKALGAASERMGNQLPTEEQAMNSLLDPLLANFTVLFGGKERVDYLSVGIGVTVILAVLLSVWYLFRQEKAKKVSTGCMLCLMVPVLVRYLVLGNHSYLHCFFTYRALVVVVFVVLTAFWMKIKITTA